MTLPSEVVPDPTEAHLRVAKAVQMLAYGLEGRWTLREAISAASLLLRTAERFMEDA